MSSEVRIYGRRTGPGREAEGTIQGGTQAQHDRHGGDCRSIDLQGGDRRSITTSWVTSICG